MIGEKQDPNNKNKSLQLVAKNKGEMVVPKKCELQFGAAKVVSQSGVNIFKFALWKPTRQLIHNTVFAGIRIFSGRLAFTFFEKYQLMCWDQGALNTQITFLEIINGNNKGFQKEAKQANRALLGPMHAENLTGPDAQQEGFYSGPPPGFEVPIYNPVQQMENGELVQASAVDSGNTRRSRRLREKYSNDRVRYDEGKRRYNKKSGKPKKVTLEYQQTLDPLTKQQAETLVQMAGIEMHEGIDEAVAKIVIG